MMRNSRMKYMTMKKKTRSVQSQSTRFIAVPFLY
jgi:hypothetical protein